MEDAKVPLSVKVIAIFLIIYSAFIVSTTLIALLVASNKYHASMLTSLTVPIIFLVGGIGLLKLKAWSLWLVNVLLVVSFASVIWNMIEVPTVRTTGWVAAYIFSDCVILAMFTVLIKKKHLFK